MKIYFKLLGLFACCVFSVLLVSCGDDSKDEPTPSITPVTPEPNNALTQIQQKEKLENVAIEFMNQLPSSDFDDISSLGNYMRNNYGEDYDWESVGDWARDLWDNTKQATGLSTSETNWGYTIVYTNYNSLLMASNFRGHFTAENGKWTRTDAEDLQFIFNDQNGTRCVLKLVTSGSIKKVHAGNIDEYQYYDYYGSTEYYDRTDCTIGVPENIIVTLTQGSNVVVKTTVKIDLQSLSGNEFDISKNDLSLTSLIELNNGYKFNLSQVSYKANKEVSTSFVMSKNGKTMITLAASSTLSGIPQCNASAFTNDFDIDDYNTDNANASNPYVKADILGKVQIQGKLKNVRDFVENLQDADDNYSNEVKYKQYISNANSLMDVNVFYDGSSTKQASLRLEPFIDWSWNGKDYWTVEPVIVFFDGSSYSTFEAFFNNTNFKKTVDSFKHLANRYASLIDETIYW